jgi:GAF domain-containing protein
MTDQQALSRVLRQFARTMASGYDVTPALCDLSDSLVEVLGATAAGVALLDGDDLRFVTATSDAAAEAERVQERLQCGPCIESVRTGQPVPVRDVRSCRQIWPEWASAVEEIGFRAALGIPLVLDDRRIGSLDIYSCEPREWSEDAVDAALVLADIGAAFVVNASELAQRQRTTAQLQTALNTRVVIEQAKGVLAERLGISPDEAFQQIRASARSHGTKVRDLCRRVIDTDHVPD